MFLLFSRRSAYRADTCTSTALNASISVDNVLAVTLRDSAYRTLASASSAANTIVRNNICHNKSTSIIIKKL